MTTLLKDRFIYTGNGGGGVLHTADGAWGLSSPGSATTRALDAGPGHVGVLRVRTSNAIGSHLRLFAAPTGWESQPPSVANQVNYDDVSRFVVRARLPDLTGLAVWLGLADQVALTGPGVNNVGFLYDTANPLLGVPPQVRCQTVVGGVLTETLVAPPAPGVWADFTVDVDHAGSGDVLFSFDGGATTVATHAAGSAPAGVGLTPYLTIFSRVNDHRVLDLDDFELVGVGP